MKKFLLSLSSLLAISASVQADNAPVILQNQAPVVEISGKFQGFGIVDAQKERSRSADNAFGMRGNLLFTVKGLVNGTEYGGVVNLDLRREKATGTKDLFKNVYVFVSDPCYGMVQLGDLGGVEEQGVVDGKDILGGTGGFWGDMWIAVQPTAGVPVDYGTVAYSKYATKLIYKTAAGALSGWQVMIDYTPSSKLYGTVGRQKDGDFEESVDKSLGSKRKVSAGVSYTFSLGEAAISLYGVGSFGSASVPNKLRTNQYNSVQTYQFGVFGEYSDYQFGAGFVDNQKSLMQKGGAPWLSEGNAGKMYNAAVGYTFGPNTVAVGYMGATRKVVGGNANANVGSLTYERKLAPGWTVFAEANYFQTKNSDQYLVDAKADPNSVSAGLFGSDTIFKNNRGSVFLVGTTVRF